MNLKPELIQKTKDYFFKKTGLLLTDEKAEEYLVSLSNLGFLLAKLKTESKKP